MEVPARYPFEPLKFRFLPSAPSGPPLIHPNISPDDNTCYFSSSEWSPSMTSFQTFIRLQALLSHPDATAPPANPAAAALLAEDAPAFYAALRRSGRCIVDGGADGGALTPAPECTHNFISALIFAAQNGFGHDVEPFLALSHETWDEEILFDAVKDLPHGVQQRTRLMHAAKVGDVARLRWLLARGARVDRRDWEGRTALYWACSEGRAGAAAALLQHGAGVNSQKAAGTTRATPLHVACTNGHLEVVRVLLAHGAAVEARDTLGATALFAACAHGNLEVVRELLARGAAVDARAVDDSATPLLGASERGHVEIVRELLARGATPPAWCTGVAPPRPPSSRNNEWGAWQPAAVAVLRAALGLPP